MPNFDEILNDILENDKEDDGVVDDQAEEK